MDRKNCEGVYEVELVYCFYCGKSVTKGDEHISVDIERNRVLSFCSKECKNTVRQTGYISNGKHKVPHYNKFPRVRRVYIEASKTDPTFQEFVKTFSKKRRR